LSSKELLESEDDPKRPGYCMLNIDAVPKNEYMKSHEWGIGSSLMYKYCVVMDFKEGFIGFGPIKNV
jgi:hypothetical protein